MKKNCCWVIYKRVIIQNQANEHNTDKQNLEKKMVMLRTEYHTLVAERLLLMLIQKLENLRAK